MRFITFLDALPGQYLSMARLLKKIEPPEGGRIETVMGMLGEPDAFIIFEAPDEASAADFTVQFNEVAQFRTSVIFPAEKLRWTR